MQVCETKTNYMGQVPTVERHDGLSRACMFGEASVRHDGMRIQQIEYFVGEAKQASEVAVTYSGVAITCHTKEEGAAGV